ncbi:MAG TPA: DUF3619 family protein [Ramlibacter sp.]|nr:DUF3619 family protein [Ramlibacter sp.]
MNSTDPQSAHRSTDQFGFAVAARLSAGTDGLSHEIRERLRAARVRALQARKQEAQPLVVGRGASASLALNSEEVGFWGRVASVLPLLALAAGLVLLHGLQSERRVNELAEVDQALLTDDLPPAAYADPGFVQFLKSGQ